MILGLLELFFRRYEITLWDDDCGLVLFHYVGDDEKARQVSAQTPHGNSKTNTTAYFRRSPLLITSLRSIQKSFKISFI